MSIIKFINDIDRNVDILAKILLIIFIMGTLTSLILYKQNADLNKQLKEKVVSVELKKEKIEVDKNSYKKALIENPTTITTGNGEFNISIGTVHGSVNVNGK